MKSIYRCPHCGKRTFNPLTKAFLGGMRTKGKPCKACGFRCVNGAPSMIFSAIVYILAFIFILVVYFRVSYVYWDCIFILGALILAYVLCRLFDAFIGPLVPVVRNDSES